MKKRSSTSIQSLMFSRSAFSPATAQAWARQHEFASAKVDAPPTGQYYHLRQHPPEKYQRGTLRTITLMAGVKAVVGKALVARAAANPARRNRTGAKVPAKAAAVKIKGFRAKNPAEARAVAELADRYQRFHWGDPPKRVLRISDPAIPKVTQIGLLRQMTIDGEPLDFPEGSHIAWDPRHPADRLYIIVPAAMREKFRQMMKKLDKRTRDLNDIAKAQGGAQARYRYPRIRAISLGPVTNVVYNTLKVGDGDSDYTHDFAEEHGVPPVFAIDVSGRAHLVAGDMRVTDAGIVN